MNVVLQIHYYRHVSTVHGTIMHIVWTIIVFTENANRYIGVGSGSFDSTDIEATTRNINREVHPRNMRNFAPKP